MDLFLERYRNSGNIRASCQAAGVPRSTIYYWQRKFSTFAAEMDDAKDDAVDALDLEAWKRATQGESDRLLMFLLQAHRPEVYKPVQTIKHSGEGEDGAIIVEQRYTDAERVRGLSALFDAVRTGLLAGDDGGDDAVDASERATVVGVSEPGG